MMYIFLSVFAMLFAQIDGLLIERATSKWLLPPFDSI
jgi:hypothetical protein